jgi:hypothetical protein
MKKYIFAAVAAVFVSAAVAQTITPGGGGGGGGGGTPGGSSGQIQYNNGGAFGGVTGATSDGTSVTMISPTLVTPVLGTPASGNAANLTNIQAANISGVVAAASGGAGAVTGLLTANGSGLVSAATIGSGLSYSAGTLTGVSTTTTAQNYFPLGDSITAASTGVTTPITQGYAYLVSYDVGGPVKNYGLAGSMACDNLNSGTGAFANIPFSSLQSNAMFSSMFGTNEANTKGVGGYEVNYHACNQALAEWFSLPASYWVYAQSATQTGTWVADTTPQAGVGETSTTNGSTLTFSITTNGGPIYLLYRSIDSDSGTFTYNVDSTGAVAVSTAAATPIITGLGATSAMFSIRIPSITAGTHSVVITVTSATGASHTADVWAIGSPYVLPYAARTSYFIMGVIEQQNNTAAAATLAYNNDAQSDANTLGADGLPIKFAPTRTFVKFHHRHVQFAAPQPHGTTAFATGAGKRHAAIVAVSALHNVERWCRRLGRSLSQSQPLQQRQHLPA